MSEANKRAQIGYLQFLTVRYRNALVQIEQTPFSMVNDSESLRHTIRVIQEIAREAAAASKGDK